MLISFLLLYSNSEFFQNILSHIEDTKKNTGFYFSFIIYACFGSIVPEIMKILFIENKIKIENFYNILFGIILWGIIGIYTDIIYKIQQILFGYETSIGILIKKTLADQLFFSPLAAFIITSCLFLYKNKHEIYKIKYIFTKYFLIEYIIPVIIALWLVWIPGMLVVYSMPSNLQLPVASFIMCFWSLIITFMAGNNNHQTGGKMHESSVQNGNETK